MEPLPSRARGVKKIITLIRPHPPLFYFANTIHRRQPLALVVVEAGSRPWWSSVQERLREWMAPRSRGIEHCRLPQKPIRRRHAADYRRIFGDAWQALDRDIPILVVPKINAPQVVARLSAEKADVLLDHGTSIVGREVLATAPLALNVHWGLSPYYRGTHCTEWALMNWDPYNIGVTIHQLTQRIDGGGIVAQRRIDVAANDSVHSLNMRLTQAGTALMLQVLDQLERGLDLPCRQQDLAQGLLTLNRQWSRALRRHVRSIERRGMIARMLQSPARKARLPIVEFNRQGALAQQPMVFGPAARQLESA
jgi:folate-dependent phosphoribosylglycinamide formyltransferase PurN